MAVTVAARRDAVLDSALRTFARFGYRKTSMDDVARDAGISRPGLYFLFTSKGDLFAAAAERAVESDLAAASAALADAGRPLGERVVDAFDHWAGRYVGPLSDVSAVVEDNPTLVGEAVREAPERFAELVTAALDARVADPEVVADALLSVSLGLKHRATDRADYGRRMSDAAALILGGARLNRRSAVV